MAMGKVIPVNHHCQPIPASYDMTANPERCPLAPVSSSLDSRSILVVVAQPTHRTRLVASKGRHVEVVIGRQQHIQPALEGRISVKDAALLVLVEDAKPGRLVGAVSGRAPLVVLEDLAALHAVRSERRAKIEREITLAR